MRYPALLVCLLLVPTTALADPVSAFLITFKTLTINSVLTKIAVSLAVSLVSRALFKPKTRGFDFNEEALGRTQIVRSSIAPRRVIYGQIKVSGVLVFAGSSGARNKYMHLVIVLAGHPVEAIDEVYFNDKPATDWDDKWYSIEQHLGADDQAASAALRGAMSGHWTSDHRLRGCAYLYVRLTWDVGTAASEFTQRAWPNGIPNISAIVRGKRVYDPRSSDTAYSNNWALCVADYLRSQDGLHTPDDEIDWATVTAAANICDEDVAIGGANRYQPRYRCDGSYTLDLSPLQILEALRSAGAGAVFWTGGNWEVHAGGAVAATRDIGEDDLRGALTYQPRQDRGSLFNVVKGTYISPEHAWKPTDFPPVTNDRYEQQDGNERIDFDLDLPFTTDGIAAQRLAKIELERHRQSITVNLPCKLTVLGIKAWDVVRLTIGHLGWAEKKFQVVGWQLSDDLGIDLELIEYDDSIYNWAYGEASRVDPAPNTQLPELHVVSRPIALRLSSEYQIDASGQLAHQLQASWSSSAGGFVSGYQAQHKLSSSATWLDAGTTTGTHLEIAPVSAKRQYDMRIRAVSSLGMTSAWTTSWNYYVSGKTTRPAQVTGFLYEPRPQEQTNLFTWSPVPEADIAGYKIRAKSGRNYTWDDLADLHSGLLSSSPWQVHRFSLPYGSFVAAIVAVDTSGNESLPTYISAELLRHTWPLDRVLYIDQPMVSGWAATKNLLLEADGSLTSIDNRTWDNIQSWDDMSAWGGHADTSPDSVMLTSKVIDLGAVYSEFTMASRFAVNGHNKILISRYFKREASDSWRRYTYTYRGTSQPSNTARITFPARYLYYTVELFRDPAAPVITVGDLLVQILRRGIEQTIWLDVDTSAWSGSADTGRVIPTDLSSVSQIQIALQSVGPGWSWEIVSKSPPTIRIYDSNRQPQDAVVDVYLTGDQ